MDVDAPAAAGGSWSPGSEMSSRFRGYLPVVVDLETGGFDPDRHAILEMAAVEVVFEGEALVMGNRWVQAVAPYPGSALDPAALKVTGIDPGDPGRGAIDEASAFREMFRRVRRAMKRAGCQRAILVAHNAAFDHQFMQRAYERNRLNRSPFHPFSFIDTASLGAVAFGHTVLSECCQRAGIAFDASKAHSALYDAEKAGALFCEIVNRWRGAWPRG
ncbi:MAG: ribonuclease T [Pseudomonadales bacterium]|jgi:ribonuclease T